MPHKATKLGNVQLQIMQVLWERGSATAREITDALSQSSPIAHSTVQTLIRQLEAKGVVGHEIQDRTFVFKPLSAKEGYKANAVQDVLSRVFNGSVYGMVSQLLENETISEDELTRLRSLIDSMEPAKSEEQP